MDSWRRAERKFGRFAPANVTLYLIIGQTLFYVLAMTRGPELYGRMALVPAAVLQGEVWRLATFVFMPPTQSVFFAFFVWYLFYLMGSALEDFWGSFRYDLYLLIGYAATVAASFAAPYSPATNLFLQSSVFLAFAYLNPDFTLLLFFVLPVKIRWLALLTWLGYGASVVFGTWQTRALVLASVANFLLFFGRDLSFTFRGVRRRMANRDQRGGRQRLVHRCLVCGITADTHPHMDFRYCPDCKEQSCYCQAHIREHEHRTS